MPKLAIRPLIRGPWGKRGFRVDQEYPKTRIVRKTEKNHSKCKNSKTSRNMPN